MNIHGVCKFDDMSSSSTWKQLLQRRMTSPYVPFGSNKQLQRDMETVFRNEGILAFSNCCGTCFNAYEGDDPDNDGEYSPENLVNVKTGFKFRTDGGIYFFKLFLNGMNYIHNQHPHYPVFVAKGGFASYKDYWYLAQHWEEECEIIHRWCSVLGLSKDEYTIIKPDPGSAVDIKFHKRSVALEDPPNDFNPMELLIESMFGNVVSRESASLRSRG